jgi:hypothetical protein
MSTKKTTARKRAAVTTIQPPAEPNPLPDWLTETPYECEYSLLMYGPDQNEQEVHMARAEYIALKQHLAEMRGYKVPDAAKENAA